ncbi:Salicylate hydroxylase [Klebsiella pneumoniae IS46]|nr:Salicylate hydroxylase [Klebsiella pneumoniae IS46]
MQFGKRVTRCEEDADGVTVWFTDGSSASGDLLIAADGSHSALRPWVLGFTPQRRYAGYVNWNGLVEIDEALAPRRPVDHLCWRRQARLADAGLRRPVLLFL